MHTAKASVILLRILFLRGSCALTSYEYGRGCSLLSLSVCLSLFLCLLSLSCDRILLTACYREGCASVAVSQGVGVARIGVSLRLKEVVPALRASLIASITACPSVSPTAAITIWLKALPKIVASSPPIALKL